MNATISKLVDAMKAHDAERMAACFTPDYHSEQPTHPGREYTGRDTLVTIWGQLFDAVPDMECELLATVDQGSTVWSEWFWHGHYTDGSPFEMRAAIIAQLVDDGRIAAQRLYAEQVEHDGADILESERQLREPAH
jgi:ketosteroid isomerase-like protein